MTKSFSGVIFDLSGTPVANAVCTITPIKELVGQDGGARGASTRTYTANGSGLLSVPDIKIGRYVLVAFVPANPATSQTVARTVTININADTPDAATLEYVIEDNAEDVTPSILQQALDAAAAALSAYQGRQYDTRAEFTAATAYVNGADAPADGTVVTAGGLQYVRKDGDATLSTSGLPGWLPFGDADYLGHWGIPRHGSEAAALVEGAALTSEQRTARQAILVTIFGGRTGRLVLDGWVEAFDLIQANPNRVIDTAGSLNFGGAGLAFSSRFNVDATACFVNGTLVRGAYIKAMRMAFDQPLTGGRADLIQYPTAFATRGDFGKIDHLMITRAWDGINDFGSPASNNGGTTLGLVQISAFNRPWEFDGDLHHVFVTGAIDVWTFGLNANQQAIMQDGNTLPSRIGRVDVFSAASLSTFKNGGFDIDGEPVAGVGAIPVMIDKLKLDGDRSSLILRSGKSMISQIYATELVANPQYANKILCIGGSHTVGMTDSVGDALATVEVTGGELTMVNPRLRNENVTLGKGGEVSGTGKLYLHSPRFVWPTNTQMLRNGDFATDFIADGTWTRNNVGGAGIPNPAYWEAGEAVLPYTSPSEHSGIAQVVGNLADQTYDLIIDLTNSTRDVVLFYAGQSITLAFGAVRTATLTPTTTNSTFVLRGGPTGTGDARIISISYRRTQSRYVPFVEQVGADAVLQVYDPIFDNSPTEPGIAVKFGADNRNNVLRAENCDPARFDFTPAWPLGWYKAGEVGSVRAESDVSRADMVTAIAAGFVPQSGKTYTLDGLTYLGEEEATAIADLPGLIPVGESVDIRHMGASTSDTAANITSAIQRAVDYLRPTGGIVDIPPGVWVTTAPERTADGIYTGWVANDEQRRSRKAVIIYDTADITIRFLPGAVIDRSADVAAGVEASTFYVSKSKRIVFENPHMVGYLDSADMYADIKTSTSGDHIQFNSGCEDCGWTNGYFSKGTNAVSVGKNRTADFADSDPALSPVKNTWQRGLTVVENCEHGVLLIISDGFDGDVIKSGAKSVGDDPGAMQRGVFFHSAKNARLNRLILNRVYKTGVYFGQYAMQESIEIGSIEGAMMTEAEIIAIRGTGLSGNSEGIACRIAGDTLRDVNIKNWAVTGTRTGILGPATGLTNVDFGSGFIRAAVSGISLSSAQELETRLNNPFVNVRFGDLEITVAGGLTGYDTLTANQGVFFQSRAQDGSANTIEGEIFADGLRVFSENRVARFLDASGRIAPFCEFKKIGSLAGARNYDMNYSGSIVVSQGVTFGSLGFSNGPQDGGIPDGGEYLVSAAHMPVANLSADNYGNTLASAIGVLPDDGGSISVTRDMSGVSVPAIPAGKMITWGMGPSASIPAATKGMRVDHGASAQPYTSGIGTGMAGARPGDHYHISTAWHQVRGGVANQQDSMYYMQGNLLEPLDGSTTEFAGLRINMVAEDITQETASLRGVHLTTIGSGGKAKLRSLRATTVGRKGHDGLAVGAMVSATREGVIPTSAGGDGVATYATGDAGPYVNEDSAMIAQVGPGIRRAFHAIGFGGKERPQAVFSQGFGNAALLPENAALQLHGGGNGRIIEIWDDENAGEVISSLGKNGDFSAQSLRSNYVNISVADDAAVQISLARTGGVLVVYALGQATMYSVSFIRAQSGGSLNVSIATGADMDLSTGALTGTTGTDTNCRVSVDGQSFWIENRSGSAKNFAWALIG